MEALAQLFRNRVTVALPFIDRAVGYARLQTSAIPEGESTRTLKLPVPVAFTAAECETDSRYLVPDAGTVSILFFEDGGTTPFSSATIPASLNVKQTSLRLLLWVNQARLSTPISEAMLLAAIEKALHINQRYVAGDFVDILTTYTLLPAEANLFSRYTYDTETPLLLPPVGRVLGLDLRVQFRLASNCLTNPLPTVIPAPSC